MNTTLSVHMKLIMSSSEIVFINMSGNIHLDVSLSLGMSRYIYENQYDYDFQGESK